MIAKEDRTEEKVLSLGTLLLKVVRKVDKSLAGMIFNTYSNCLFLATSTLYAGSTIFLNKYRGADLYCICTLYFSLAVLCIMRLLYLTNAGQSLGTAMKACVHTLGSIKFKSKDVCFDDLQLVKQNLKYYSESPINPCSAFYLSNGTLIGTSATVITYLIILIQFKATEIQNHTCNCNNTVSEFSPLNGFNVSM